MKNRYIILLAFGFLATYADENPAAQAVAEPQAQEAGSESLSIAGRLGTWFSGIVTDFFAPTLESIEKQTPGINGIGKTFITDAQKALEESLPGLQVAGSEFVDEASKKISQAGSNAAEKITAAGETVINNAQTKIQQTMLSSLLSASWLLPAAAGVALVYHGIKKHTGKIKSKQTLEIAFGSTLFIFSLYRMRCELAPTPQPTVTA